MSDLDPPAGDDANPDWLLDRYELCESHARGSTAEVYQAQDRTLASDMSEALVAVKMSSGVSRDALPQFLDEAKRARAVTHDNVVRVLDAGRSRDGRAVIVQEWIDGRTLDKAILDPASRWSVRRVVSLIAEIADGLEAVHAAGLVHCDLKPSNVLVDALGRPRIVDFGAASRRRSTGDGEPTASALRGAPAFIAPERLANMGARPTPSADLYALGALAVWALVAADESADEAGSALLVLQTASKDGEASVTDRRGEVLGRLTSDPDLRAILSRATLPEPADRYASAGALASDLRRWLRREPIEWTKPGMRRKLALFGRRQPALVALGATLIVALGAALVASESARRHAASNALAQDARAAAELDAAIAKAEREQSEIWKQRVGEQLASSVLPRLRAASDRGFVAQVLPSLWVLEHVFGPTVLERPELLEEVWSARIDTFDGLIERLEASGDDDPVESQMQPQLMRVSLGLWLARAGEWDRAIETLETARSYWAGLLEPSDPWLERIDDLLLAARLDRAAATGEDTASMLERAQRRASAFDASRQSGPVVDLLERAIERAAPVIEDAAVDESSELESGN